MANMVKSFDYGKNQKQILIGQDSFYIGLPIVLSGSANATIYAGQPLTGDIEDRDTAFTASTSSAKGVLLHDVVLDSDGKGNGTLVLAGCVDLLKLEDNVVTAIETAKADLPRIIFVKGSAI
jgi:hypothetical protein